MGNEERKFSEPDWEAELERQHRCEERYDRLARRVEKLETKTNFFSRTISDERLHLYLIAIYIFFAYILPTIRGQVKS